MATTIELREGVVGGFVPAALRLHIRIELGDGAGKATVRKLNKKTFHPTDADYDGHDVQLDGAAADALKRCAT